MHAAIRIVSLQALMLTAVQRLPAEPASSRLESSDLRTIARAVPPGGALRIEGVRLEESKPEAVLDLERFEALAAGARIVVHGEDRARERC